MRGKGQLGSVHDWSLVEVECAADHFEAVDMNASEREGHAEVRSKPRHHLIPAMLIALSVVVIFFVLYEIVERTWLSDADTRLLHGLHITRGVLSSVIAALLVGWVIIRRLPPLLETIPSEDERLYEPDHAHQERVESYARWFIHLRWVAVVVAAASVFICVLVVPLLPPVVLWPLILTITVLAGTNLVYTALLHSGSLKRYLLQLQVYFDLIILTVLLHFSGGIENPLSTLMLLHVIIGGIILTRWQCYTVAIAASVLFGLLALAEATELIEHYTLQIFPHFANAEEQLHAAHEPLYVSVRVGLQSAILFLSAYFVVVVAERQRHDERQLKKMAVRALAESQLLDQSLENTGTALRVLDSDLRSVWMNKRWQEWFGGDDPCSSITERLDGPDSAARQTLQDGQSRSTELTTDEVMLDEGSPSSTSRRFFMVTTAPLRNPAGHVHQVVEVAQDITEPKQTQAQLIRAGQLAAVGELAGKVAHEVNNPIAIISAKARLLLSDRREEMGQEIANELEKIITLSDRVADIAQGLLSYGRPSTAAREFIDIRPSLNGALSMIEQRAVNAGIELRKDIGGSHPTVLANAHELEQVFLNLLLNAIDAMPDGGTLTIRMSQSDQRDDQHGNCLSITLQDTGSGISHDVLDRIFEPFFTTKEQGKGTGLGLSICQGLVRSFGGEIDVQSEVGQGTRVTVRLPVAALE